MRIVGLGTEIVECVRIRRLLERHGEQFLTRAYTDHEVRDCQHRTQAGEAFASYWAGKEAVLRALGTGRTRGIARTDVEISLVQGTPSVVLTGAAGDLAASLGVGDIWLTLAACRAYATATAILLAIEL